MDWIEESLAEKQRQGLYRSRLGMQSSQGPRVRLDGRDYVNFSSNDYLNLASDPRLGRASARAALRWGCGAGASPLISGYSVPLRLLERELAQWEGTARALVFSSGFTANLGVISSLVGRDDLVLSDAWNHASIIDGCRLARARVSVYPHGDLAVLREQLQSVSHQRIRRFIVTDSLFSMDGDLAPLQGLLDLAEEFDAVVVLDEAHASGVFGEKGQGLSGTLQPGSWSPDRLIKVGTLSKALGSQGGFVCGSRRLIDYLINHARSYIFSTALAQPTAAAARKAIRLIQLEPYRRQHLLRLALHLRSRLFQLGFNLGPSTSQIVPVILGRSEDAVQLSQSLRSAGFLVPAIRPPSVPHGTARLRISITAGHTEEDINQLLVCLTDARCPTGTTAPRI